MWCQLTITKPTQRLKLQSGFRMIFLKCTRFCLTQNLPVAFFCLQVVVGLALQTSICILTQEHKEVKYNSYIQPWMSSGRVLKSLLFPRNPVRSPLAEELQHSTEPPQKPAPQTVTPIPPSRTVTNLYCFEPPGLQQFVTTTIGREYTSLPTKKKNI